MRRVAIRFRDPRGVYRLLAELMRMSSPLRWAIRTRREGKETIVEVPASAWNDDVEELVIGFGGQRKTDHSG